MQFKAHKNHLKHRRTHTHMHTYICMHMHTHTHTHTYMRMHAQTYNCRHTNTHIQNNKKQKHYTVLGATHFCRTCVVPSVRLTRKVPLDIVQNKPSVDPPSTYISS